MANISQGVYDIHPVRALKADGTQTTIGVKLIELIELRRKFPDKKVRHAAVNKASAEFDALHPGDKPRTRKDNRSAYVRRVLFTRSLSDD